MKLLVSIGSLAFGGAERVLSILSGTFAESFDEVIYLLWMDTPDCYKIDSRIRIVRLPEISGTSSRVKNIKSFRRFVEAENPDLIVSFLTPFNMLVLLSGVAERYKVIVCERLDPNIVKGGWIMKQIRNRLYQKADLCLVQTEYERAGFPKNIRNKSRVIYNPVNMPVHYLGSALEAEKEDLIVSVGRLHPQKNQAMIIRMMRRLHPIFPTYRMVIYGEGELRDELEKMVSDFGLNDVVSLPGSSPKVWDNIIRAKCFILSSDYEGMSNALIEAMCLGLPVISTKVSGSTDLIQDGVNGLLIDVGEEDALFDNIVKLLENPDTAKSLASQAAKVYDKLALDTIGREWVGAMKDVADIDAV